jgi:hypothetical protein
MKHLPFQSIYRPDFEVVEQRKGNLTFYPHNEQLPILLRAINLEFYGALSPRLARADGRATAFDKIALKSAGLLFCNALNGARPDNLLTFSIPNFDLVTRIAIVQQIHETTRHGLAHRFRFYAGDEFSPEIYLSGKRIVFSDHVLQRFSSRVPNYIGGDLSNFLMAFYGTPLIALPIGTGYGMILSYGESLLALTFKETDKEFFFTTCLTINEINSLSIEVPPRAFNLHYNPEFTRPRIRNWFPTKWMTQHYRRWQNKVPLPPPLEIDPKNTWSKTAQWVANLTRDKGHGPGSRICFGDNIPGPDTLIIAPNETEGVFDEQAIYSRLHPQYNWDEIFAMRHGEPFVRPEPAKLPEPPVGGKSNG